MIKPVILELFILSK